MLYGSIGRRSSNAQAPTYGLQRSSVDYVRLPNVYLGNGCAKKPYVDAKEGWGVFNQPTCCQAETWALHSLLIALKNRQFLGCGRCRWAKAGMLARPVLRVGIGRSFLALFSCFICFTVIAPAWSLRGES